MADKLTAYQKAYNAGFSAAMLRAARIADGHRALNLNYGHVIAGTACASVACFIIDAAREAGCWDESRKQPLVLSDAEVAAAAAKTEA